MRKPGLNVGFFKARRQRVASLIPNCAVVLPAGPEYYRNADTEANYRPEGNLFYLTGFDEPESCLILRPGKTPETVMFVRQKNLERETWDGFRFGVAGAKEVFGFDEVYPIEDIETIGAKLLKGCERVYYSVFRNPAFDTKFGRMMIDGVGGWRQSLSMGLPPIEDAQSLVGEFRMRKTEEEIELMRKACGITAEAHIELMKATRPGVSERHIHGIFLKEIMQRGATTEAYGGIVASGANATTLHYKFNENQLEAGQMILVDCGAEYQFYSGDITRTYPVNGRFSATQKRIYEKLLHVQKQLIQMVRPGVLHIDLQTKTIELLTQILIEEQILKGSVDENIKNHSFAPYYPHGVSHLLGLDTHDAGPLRVKGQSRPLEPGFVLTIEPGLYFRADNPHVPSEIRGLGIRIEDDVLVTPEGPDVLTKGVPKDVEEMEALIGSNYR